MPRTIRIIPALLTTAAAMGLAWALPAGASAMGTMTAQAHTRPVPEHICRPNLTCAAQWHMTVPATVPLSPGEVVGADHKILIDLYGDDPISDDYIQTLTIPFRQVLPKGTCSDGGTSLNVFSRSFNGLVIRGCFRSAKRYGAFNEDDSFFDDGDELLIKVRLVDGRGVTVRSATARTYGKY